MPLQQFGNRVPKYLPPTRNGLGLGPVHVYFVSAWTCSLGSWACWKWNITFLSIGIRVVEKHKVFVSIQQVQLWDLWQVPRLCFLISVAIIPKGVKPSGFAKLERTFCFVLVWFFSKKKRKGVFFSIPLCHNQRIK